MLEDNPFYLVVVVLCKMNIVFSSLLVICWLNPALPSQQQSEVKRQIFSDQIKRMSHQNQRNVPNGQLFNTGYRTRRQTEQEAPRPVEFLVDGKKFVFNLLPADHVVMPNSIPVWRAKTVNGRSYNYEVINQTMIGGTILQDPEKMGSFVAYYRSPQEIYYDGVFGESAELKVLNGELEKPYYSGGHAFPNINNKIVKNVAFHPREILNITEDLLLDTPLDTFNLKLLVVVHYSLFQKLDKDINKTVRYMTTFWNAVNLKYTQIEIPKIKIHVKGLIISEDLTAMKYIYESRYEGEPNIYEANKIISFGGKYFRDEFYNSNIKFDNYDAVVTMADIIALGPYSISLGTSYPEGICSEDRNVLFVKDDGNYAGVIRAAHELAHSLNIWHDEQYKDRNCTGSSSEENTSTVMATFEAKNVKKFVWSDCSKKHFQISAWKKTSLCLKDTDRHRH